MRWPAWFTCSALVACAGASGTREAAVMATMAVEGTYDYIANLPGQQVRGKMRFLADTVLVDPIADYCRPTVRTPDPLAIHYTCNGPGSFELIQLQIDRRSPTQLSKWTATFRVQKRREVCRRYGIQAGQQVCVERATETYDVSESRSGTLQVRRAP